MEDRKNEKLLVKAALWAASFVLLTVLTISLLFLISACSPKVIEHVTTQIEYRDRYVHDTTEVQIPVEVEKIVTRDTASHLENTYAKSDAVVSDGLLSHSLESKPQIIKVPVEVHVTDTIIKESEIKTEIQYVEKELTSWQKFKQKGFWWLLAATAGCLAWIFRKPIKTIISKLFK